MKPHDKRQPPGRNNSPPPGRGGGRQSNGFVEVSVTEITEVKMSAVEDRFRKAKVIVQKRGLIPGLIFWAVTYVFVVSLAYSQDHPRWGEYFSNLFARGEPGWWHLAGVVTGAMVYSFYRFGRANWFDAFWTTMMSLLLYVVVVGIANRSEIYYNPGYRLETLKDFLFLNGSRHDISVWNFLGAFLTFLLIIVYVPGRPWFFGLFQLPSVLRAPTGRTRGESMAPSEAPRF